MVRDLRNEGSGVTRVGKAISPMVGSLLRFADHREFDAANPKARRKRPRQMEERIR
jgi:hypothetical protein